jgi:hypothetical protein
MIRTRKGGPISGLVIGILFSVIGCFFAFAIGKPILDDAKASRDWPSVPGVITRSAVATKNSGGKTRYRYDVVYRYQVEGRELTCSNVFFGDDVFFGGDVSSRSSDTAYKVTKRYPEGAEVAVYYEPEDPASAVLEPGARWQSYVLFVIGLVFLIVGVLSLGSSLRSLFSMLAAGAIIGGVTASGLGGSSSRKRAPDRFDPDLPPSTPSQLVPPQADATDAEDDGFDLG